MIDRIERLLMCMTTLKDRNSTHEVQRLSSRTPPLLCELLSPPCVEQDALHPRTLRRLPKNQLLDLRAYRRSLEISYWFYSMYKFVQVYL